MPSSLAMYAEYFKAFLAEMSIKQVFPAIWASLEYLQREMEQPCFQYADDTTIVAQRRPNNCYYLENAMENDLVKLNAWSASADLALNPRKTKVMILSTKQLSRHHSLDDFSPALKIR